MPNLCICMTTHGDRMCCPGTIKPLCTQREQLWERLCSACAEKSDATDESNAKPSLLQDYIEAAYLLPCILETSHMYQEAALGLTFYSNEGSVVEYEATGCLKLFHNAMLPPYPLHLRLTACACLLRVWAVEITDARVKREPSMPFCTWVSQSGVVSGICACLKAGLEVSSLEGAWQGLHQTGLLPKCPITSLPEFQP